MHPLNLIRFVPAEGSDLSFSCLRSSLPLAPLITLLMLVAACTLSGCALESRFYKPSVSEPVLPQGAEDVQLPGPRGSTLHAWFLPAPSRASGAAARRPAIVFCHGNQATIDYFAPRLESLRRDADVSLVLFSYRGYGRSSPLDTVTRATTVADAKAALEGVFQRSDVDPSQIYVMGYSLGGVAALAAAAEDPRVRGVIVGGTYARAADALKDSGYGWARALIGGAFDPADSIARLGPRPVFIFHGEQDTTPRTYHAYELAAEASRHGVPVEIFIVPNAGHYTAADEQSGTLKVIASFLNKHTKPNDLQSK